MLAKVLALKEKARGSKEKMLVMLAEMVSMKGSRRRNSVAPSDVVNAVTDELSSVAPTK